MCPCDSRKTHYLMLEKHGAQNIAALKNQSKQRDLMLFFKKKIKNKQRITQKRQKDLLEYKFY